MLLGTVVAAPAHAQPPADDGAAPPGPVVAEPAPPPPAAQSSAASERADLPRDHEGPGRGVVFQGLLATQGLLDSGTITTAGLRTGYRFGRFTLAAAFGFNILRLTDDESTLTGTVFTISPTVFVDLWSSRDDRVKFGVLGSVGLGYLRASDKLDADPEFEDPEQETISDAIVIPFSVGVYGDYFMHRNFALGVEGGFKGLPTAGGNTTSKVDGEDVPTEGDPPSFGVAVLGFYGAIRFTVVLGR